MNTMWIFRKSAAGGAGNDTVINRKTLRDRTRSLEEMPISYCIHSLNEENVFVYLSVYLKATCHACHTNIK